MYVVRFVTQHVCLFMCIFVADVTVKCYDCICMIFGMCKIACSGDWQECFVVIAFLAVQVFLSFGLSACCDTLCSGIQKVWI